MNKYDQKILKCLDDYTSSMSSINSTAPYIGILPALSDSLTSFSLVCRDGYIDLRLVFSNRATSMSNIKHHCWQLFWRLEAKLPYDVTQHKLIRLEKGKYQTLITIKGISRRDELLTILRLYKNGFTN